MKHNRKFLVVLSLAFALLAAGKPINVLSRNLQTLPKRAFKKRCVTNC